MASREKILIADHNPRFLERTREILEGAGYQVHTVTDLAGAARGLSRFGPDVVLSGVRLEGGDGYRLVRAVKRDHDPSVPCVLMFSRADEQQVTACFEAGAENHLKRPLKKSELLGCVRDMVLIHRLKQRLARLQGEVGPPARGSDTGLRDARTGFYTFGYFKEALYVEVKRTRRHGYPLAVMLIAYDRSSLDDGALTEDGVADELYGGLALAVRRSIRETDLPVSYTPENVLVLMPHTDLEGGVTVAKRVRSVIKHSRIRAGDTSFNPTLSMGVCATSQLKDPTFSRLVKTATRALRHARKRGGNCIVY